MATHDLLGALIKQNSNMLNHNMLTQIQICSGTHTHVNRRESKIHKMCKTELPNNRLYKFIMLTVCTHITSHKATFTRYVLLGFQTKFNYTKTQPIDQLIKQGPQIAQNYKSKQKQFSTQLLSLIKHMHNLKENSNKRLPQSLSQVKSNNGQARIYAAKLSISSILKQKC